MTIVIIKIKLRINILSQMVIWEILIIIVVNQQININKVSILILNNLLKNLK